VAQIVRHYLEEEFGNSGSRTHAHGTAAKRAVEAARNQIAAVVAAKPDEVVFTSGATESNNLSLLGLAEHGRTTNRMHIISTAIEHKAVLEPLEVLEKQGFEIELLRPESGGWVSSQQLADALRDDTLLVSVMHANNETGVLQPISEIAAKLNGHEAYFHVDAAQSFGKELEALRDSRIDLISASSHKLYGPKGVGALIARRRRFTRAPLTPLLFGGGQEKGLRPGTLPVPLVAGFGLAAELAVKDNATRKKKNRAFREKVLSAFMGLGAEVNGDPVRCQDHVLNASLPGLDSEAAILALKDIISISNGSACTSSSYKPSHVLEAMGLEPDRIEGALRISWWHGAGEVEWEAAVKSLRGMNG